MKKPLKRVSLILPSRRLRNLWKMWIYVPGVLLMLLGLSILLYPQAVRAILAGFFIGSGALMIHAIRVLKRTFEAFRQRISDLYLEQVAEDEGRASFEKADPPLSWVN